MSVIFQTALNRGKLGSFKKSISNLVSCYQCYIERKVSDDITKKFITFDEIVAQRRAEARRSLIVQVQSDSSFKELHSYCSKYADVKGIHHYKTTQDEHYMLVEFTTEENLKDVISSCSAHQRDPEILAIHSPFLWFRALPGKKSWNKTSTSSLVVQDGISEVNEDALMLDIKSCEDVSEQIQMLHDKTMLTDIGTRLRYIVARQIEQVLESVYAHATVSLFGSSVNGFGKIGCDLDLALNTELPDDSCKSNNRLVYYQKKWSGSGNSLSKDVELIGNILELRVPGIGRVYRILHARVPIVKYTHELTDLDCDLCCNNMSGVHMSCLLWSLGALDSRVRPLTVLVRWWAKANGLTSSVPGTWITNFSVTLLVIYFLQTEKILPPLSVLFESAEQHDVRIAEESVTCTFLRDLNKLPSQSYGQNDADLQTLLTKFFEFYAQFDFAERAICLNDGKSVRKPTKQPLYIINPLQQTLNVSRNVSFEECAKIRKEIRSAAWEIEKRTEPNIKHWGILPLIEKKSRESTHIPILEKRLTNGTQKLVEMHDLFQNNSKEPEVNELRNKLQKLSGKNDKSESKNAVNGKSEPIKFKNRTIANVVKMIKRDKMV